MLIWRNLDLPSMGRMLVAASRDYRSPQPHHAPTHAPRHAGAAPAHDAPPATPPADVPPGSNHFAREVCPGWLRLIVDNRNG